MNLLHPAAVLAIGFSLAAAEGYAQTAGRAQAPVAAADCTATAPADGEPSCYAAALQGGDSSAVASQPERTVGFWSSPTGLHAGAGAVLSSDRIDQIDPTTVADLLRGPVAGAYSIDVGARNDLYRTLRIRGPISFSTCARCGPKVLVDGVEVNPIALGSLSAEHIERVEVVPGPSAAFVYGSDAAAGVIHLITRKGPDQPGTRIRAKAELGAVSSPYIEETALGQAFRASVAGDLPASSLSYNVGASHSRFAGHVPEYEGNATAVSFGVSGDVGAVAVSGFGRFTDRHVTNPGWAVAYYHLYADGLLPTWGERIDSNDFADYRNLTLGLSLDYAPVDWWRTRLTVGEDRVDLDLRWVPDFLRGDSMVTMETQRHALPSVRLQSGVEVPVGAADLAIHGGVDARQGRRLKFDSNFRETGRARVTHWRGQILDEDYTAGGAFAEGRVRFSNGLAFSGGIRADHHSFFGEQFGDWVWNPRASLSFDADLGSGWLIRPRASYSSGIVAPSYEMLTGIGNVGPNPDIGPQTTSAWEMGVDVSGLGGRITGSATAFYQSTRGALGLIRSFPGESIPLFLNFFGRVRNRGVEIAATWSGEYGDLLGNFSVLNNDVHNPTDPLEPPVAEDTSPEMVGWAEGRLALEPWLGRQAHIGGRTYYIGRRWAFDARGTYTAIRQGMEIPSDHRWFPGVVRADLFLDADLSRSISTRLEIRNFTNDVTAESPEIVVPGRQLIFSVRTRL